MDGLLESVGASAQPSYNRWIGDRCVRTLRAELGESGYSAALAEGRAMSMAHAVQFGLEETPVAG
jgi:hypothetical protein